MPLCGCAGTVTKIEDMTFTALFEEIPNTLDEVQKDQAAPHKVFRVGIPYTYTDIITLL